MVEVSRNSGELPHEAASKLSAGLGARTEVLDDLDRQERWLVEQIEAYQKSYQKAVQPYVDRLVQVRSWKSDQIVIANEFALGIALHPEET